MNLYTYIAENNPLEANKLLKNYGFSPTDSYSTLIDRLKQVVRKYKKVALQDLMTIHPDTQLFQSFTKSESSEKEFAYATGRTPGFAEPIVQKESNFIEKDNTNTEDVLAQIREVKEQIKESRKNRKRRQPNGNVVQPAGFNVNQGQFLMVAVAFALGYIIAKK